MDCSNFWNTSDSLCPGRNSPAKKDGYLDLSDFKEVSCHLGETGPMADRYLCFYPSDSLRYVTLGP